MKIITKKLILRDLKRSDAKDLQRHANNIHVAKNIPAFPYPYTKKDATKFINHCMKESKKKPRANYEFCVNLKSKGKLIGMISITKVDRFQRTCTIGYWLGEEYWRQGIASEALKKMMEFAFVKLKLRRINIEAFGDNKSSNGLIKKMGFVYEGTLRKKLRDKATKKIHDEVKYGMLREEWKASSKKQKTL